MPDERIIQEIEKILADVVTLGGQEERTSIVPNMLVRDSSPTDLDDYVIIADNRDNDNILALRVPGVVYADNDLVNVIFPTGGEAIAFQQGSGSTTSGLWDIVTGTDDIYYDKGDVGIGKSVVPDAALEILSTSQQQLRLTHTEDTKFIDFTVDTNHDLTIKPSSIGQVIFQPTTDSIDFFQVLDADGGTPILNVDSTNERVGMGAAAPNQKLEVKGVGRFVRSNGDNYTELGSENGITTLLASNPSSATYQQTQFVQENNSTSRETIRIDSSGNVGIGTSSPDSNSRLHVYESVNSVARTRVENPNTGTGAWADVLVAASKSGGGQHGYAVQMWGHNATPTWDGITLGNYARFRSDSTVSGLIITTGGSAPVIFGTNDNEAMRIDSSQNVGINQSSPASKMDILGPNSSVDIFRTIRPGSASDGTGQGWTLRAGSSGTSGSGMIFRHVSNNGAGSETLRNFMRFYDTGITLENDSATVLAVFENAGNIGFNGVTSPSTELDIGAGAIEFEEMTPPAAGAANTARLFAQDNGAGKTQLAVRFNTGAIQILATEP